MTKSQSLFFLLLLVAVPIVAQNTMTTVPLHGRLMTPSAAAPAPDRSIVVVPMGCCACTCREDGGDLYCCSDKSRLCCAGMSVTGTTRENGEFTVSVPPGKYDVFLDKIAASTKLVGDVMVTLGQSATLELRLPKLLHHRHLHKD